MPGRDVRGHLCQRVRLVLRIHLREHMCKYMREYLQYVRLLRHVPAGDLLLLTGQTTVFCRAR